MNDPTLAMGGPIPLLDNISTHLEMLPVKTTIDRPEETLHRAKIAAAQRKTTLKDLVIVGLTHAMESSPEALEIKRRERAEMLSAALSAGRNSSPVGRLRRAELYERPA